MSQQAGKFGRLKRVPAYRLVAEAIESSILSGAIRPGEPIGTEAELVRQFGVNRSTVREGLRLLEHEGLVGRRAQRRLCAALPHYERLATRWSQALILHQVTFRELYEASMVLHTGTVEAAVDRATPALLDRLDENLRRTEHCAGDPGAVAALDAEFHALIGEASGNRVLQLAREPTHMLIHPTTEAILRHVPEGTARLIAAHRRIVRALRARDREAARTWVRRHLDDWRKGFERTGRSLDEPIDRLLAAVEGGGAGVSNGGA